MSDDTIRVDVYGAMDVGRVRKSNQDYLAIVDLSTGKQGLEPDVLSHHLGSKGTLFLVSDGMGGEAAGDVASRRSVETMAKAMLAWEVDGDPSESFAKALDAAIQEGNDVVSRESEENATCRGMGATMTAAGILGRCLYVAQVGDSRLYLRRNRKLVQISHDQSLVGQLVSEGRITREEADRHPHRNIILQALGKQTVIHAELLRVPLYRGDEILMCSDGLSGMVRDPDIEKRLNEETAIESTCRDLLKMANERGGSDNITALIARFSGDGLPPHDPDNVEQTEVLKEFTFAFDEEEEEEEEEEAPEEETKDDIVPVSTAVLGADVVQQALDLAPKPPPPPAIPEPRHRGVAVSVLALVLLLLASVAAGIALARVLGHRQPTVRDAPIRPYLAPLAGPSRSPAATKPVPKRHRFIEARRPQPPVETPGEGAAVADDAPSPSQGLSAEGSSEGDSREEETESPEESSHEEAAESAPPP